MKKIVEMTPFVYEDGNIYYFEIVTRSTFVYHGLYVYKKVEKKNYITKKIKSKYVCINEDNQRLVDTKLAVKDIKSKITDILSIHTKKSVSNIAGWDGFVGDVPDEIKKAFIRDSKLKILIKD